uniref:rab11 family-interacting protein 1 isoform X2 n=1 Tax=Scatophagus argus TaxID=75038 RepID=UPI001ED81A53|nr:rab11 family-interacting protein 1 isoform X2 [Scatophagus argus]
MSLADQQWCPTSVQVTVLQARGLRIKGKNGTNDAYAVMQVGKEKYHTSVVEKSVAPVWKEEASFDLPQLQQYGGGGRGGTERSTLHVHVLHRALVGPDKLLGQAVIDLPQLSENKSRNKTEWFKLLDKAGKADKDRGEVLVDIQFMRNNMTASMFDLSSAGKSRSRLGKFKDKVRGKKKESDSASTVVPSFTQVLTDSEEEGNGDGEVAAGKDGKKKKHKMKSLFSPKSNLQRNMSQSMSVLPAKNSSLSGSQSSGLNVDSSEGKKKFKFMIHKRSGSSDSKDSSSGHQKHAAAEQSNLCINGSHIYCEEPLPRTSRIGSNFSLASSGHGSMEDVPESSPPSVDSLRAVGQYSPWTEEEEEEETAEVENIKESEDGLRREEEERIRMEEERRKEEEEERVRKQEEEAERLAEEKRRREEHERRRTEEEEKRQREEEERIRREEERAQEKRRQEEECKLAEEKRRLEEEERKRTEEEKVKKEEEERAQEERRRREEEERARREEERERLAEEKRRVEEAERRRIEEEEKRQRDEEEEKKIKMEEERAQEERRRKEEEERARRQEEEHKLAEEKRRLEEEERRRNEEEKVRQEEEGRRRKEQEEKKKQEEEMVKRQEEEREEKRRLEEQERRQREEEERKRKEEEEKTRREKEEYERLVEEKRKLEEEERKQIEEEEERVRVEEERKRNEEENVRKQEEEWKKLAEEKTRLEEQERRRVEEEEKRQREEEERIRKEDERRQEEEERARKEKEEYERLAEEKRKQEEKERERIEEEERTRQEEQERIRMENERRRQEEENKILEKEKIQREEEERIKREEKAEEEARKLEKEKVTRNAEEQKSTEKKTKHNDAGTKSKVESSVEVTSSNLFDENFSNNPSEESHNSSAGPDSSTAKGPVVQQRSQSAVSSLGSKTAITDEKDLISTQREKRQAPQPPGRTQAQRENHREHDGSTRHLAQINKQSKDKDVKTVSILPQRSVQMITPLSKSPTDAKSAQSLMESSTAKVTTNAVKHGKRPAPSRPRSVDNGSSSGPKTASSSDSKIPSSSEAKQEPTVYGLNPFEDDEDENELTAQDDTTTNTGPVRWPPAVAQAADKDGDSQAKIKSSKKTRAPSFPETAVQESRPAVMQSTGEKPGEKKEGPPAASRRLLPVKPLNPQAQQPVSVVQVEIHNKSTGILSEVQEKTKVNDTGLKGPYSQLTREELIALLLKQENQLSERNKKISELEEYIDNLLVRVMEEKPSILMSLNSMKKTA